MKYFVAILKSESKLDHRLWIKACEKNQSILKFDVIDITKDNWFEEISSKEYDLILLRPPGKTELFKRLYDERVFSLYNYSKTNMYPSIQEILIYENKRFLRDWLVINNLPHPKTYVFFYFKEAKSFILNYKKYPIVAKTNIGASGNGVMVLNSRQEASDYCSTAFSSGITPTSRPKLNKGSLIRKIKKAITIKGFMKHRFQDYTSRNLLRQSGYVIFQEFIPHDYEWRCIRIGDSYFAHKKIAKNNKSSGTLIKEYCDVPHSILNFIKETTEKTGLYSVAIDIFEIDHSQYLINEIQCFFGQSDPHQMLIDNMPGRYIWKNNTWTFEQGDFNSNESFDLRLEHAISLIS